VFVTLAGVACAMTLVFLGMRAVMDIGGSCASGGPYVVGTPCPKGIALIMVGGIWGGLILAGLYAWQSIKAGALSFLGLLWPALFISLGVNFLQYGISPPGEDGGPVVGWLICAVLFLAMGGLPLLPALAGIARRLQGEEPERTGWRAMVNPTGIRSSLSALSAMRKAGLDVAQSWPGMTNAPGAGSGPSPPGGWTVATRSGPAASGKDLVAKLAELDALHTRGALTDQEFEAAKRALLHTEG